MQICTFLILSLYYSGRLKNYMVPAYIGHILIVNLNVDLGHMEPEY